MKEKLLLLQRAGCAADETHIPHSFSWGCTCGNIFAIPYFISLQINSFTDFQAISHFIGFSYYFSHSDIRCNNISKQTKVSNDTTDGNRGGNMMYSTSDKG